MARYAESVYCVNLGGPRARELSPSGDGTVWVEREPGGSFRLQRIAPGLELAPSASSPGRVAVRVVAEARVGAEEGRFLDELLASLPEGGVPPAPGDDDGLHRRLIVSTPTQIECYFWWAFDDSDEPALRTLERIVSLIERWLPHAQAAAG